jgi:hypothetical protein
MLLLLTLLLAVSSCQEKKTDNPEQLKAVLIGYFDGIETKDFQKMHDLTTEDFVLFEDGVVFTNDSLFNMMNSFESFSADYNFENLKIYVDNRSGNIQYYNPGNFIFNDTIEVKLDWLESATFKKIDGEWKMDFLHSTVRK